MRVDMMRADVIRGYDGDDDDEVMSGNGAEGGKTGMASL